MPDYSKYPDESKKEFMKRMAGKGARALVGGGPSPKRFKKSVRGAMKIGKAARRYMKDKMMKGKEYGSRTRKGY